MNVVGGQSVYDLPFRMSSRAVHATDLFDHIEWKSDGSLIMKSLPGDRWTPTVLDVANLFFSMVITEADAFAELGVGEEIEKINAEFEAR